MTETFRTLQDVPRSPPFDRVGVVCLAWAAVFIALTGVLAVTLK